MTMVRRILRKVSSLCLLLAASHTLSHHAFADDISPLPNGIRGFVQSNVCSFPSTVIATVKDVSMRDWYKPLAYFDNHRIYILDVGDQQVLKGHKQAQNCFVQWREPPYAYTRNMVGKTYLISFTPHRDGCSTIETGAQIQMDAELLAWAKQHTFANDRCDVDAEGPEENRQQ